MEDTEIIELFFDRSERAVAETREKYGAYLHQMAYRILRDLQDSEEIVNDTYMAAWERIPPTRPVCLKYFLSRITRNLSFDRLDYKNAGKRHAMFVEMEECIPDRRGSAAEVWEAREIGEALNRFLKTLDAESCAVFLARYYYSCPLKELAKRYGLSARQVKYLLAKLRKRLKDFLEKEGVII